MRSWASGKHLVGHLQEEHAAALKTEQLVGERIKEGVDSPQMQNKAHLGTARLRLRLAEAQGRHRRDPQPAFASDRTARSFHRDRTGIHAAACRKSSRRTILPARQSGQVPAVQAADNRADGRKFPGPR